jgi:hypothetical protein
MQDGATAHNATYSINVLNEVFENILISRGLWPARSLDLNPCDCYLWGNLKDKVYSNNPRTLVEFKESIRETISSIEVSELKLLSNNIFKRLEACLRAEGKHFEHHCDGKSFKQCIYFQKCTYVFTMHGISSARRSNFSRQMTLAFRTHKPRAKESGECVVRGIPGTLKKVQTAVVYGRKDSSGKLGRRWRHTREEVTGV